MTYKLLVSTTSERNTSSLLLAGENRNPILPIEDIKVKKDEVKLRPRFDINANDHLSIIDE